MGQGIYMSKLQSAGLKVEFIFKDEIAVQVQVTFRGSTCKRQIRGEKRSDSRGAFTQILKTLGYW